LIVTALAASACGSASSDGAAAPEATTTAVQPMPASDEAGDTDAYCDASLAIELVQPDIDFETATPEEMTEGLMAFASDDLLPLLDKVESVAPSELGDEVETYRAAIGQLGETGDPSVFDDQALLAAEQTAHAYDLEHCGWSTADVVTTDYAFGGLAAAYEAGPTSIDLTNEGDEVHEMAVLMVKAGVGDSTDDIIHLSQEEAFEKVDFVGSVDPVAPGDAAYAVLDLEPGRYIVSCFLAEGTTSMEALETAEGQPHAMLGMFQEITVSDREPTTQEDPMTIERSEADGRAPIPGPPTTPSPWEHGPS